MRRRGPRYKITTENHLLKDIFEQQLRIGLSDDRLATKIGMAKTKIAHLRNPDGHNNKSPTWSELTRLAMGVGLTIYARTFLRKDAPPNTLPWILSIEEVK